MAATALGSYLNDHLAGAMLGSDLSARIRDRHDGEPLGETMTALAVQIEEDRELLITLMDRLEVPRNVPKQASTWVAEQASRPKFSGLTSGDGELGTFLALESLTLGVIGKLALWRVLERVAGDHPGLAGIDFAALAADAERQRDVLERERLMAAERSLAAGD